MTSVKHTFLQVCLVLIYLAQNSTAGSAEEDLTFTQEEKEALEEFRPRALPYLEKEYMTEDIYLMRWLRAKNLNVDLAERMLVDNLRWRESEKMDGINDEDWSDMAEEHSYNADTFDKFGRPIGTINFGNWNIRRLVLTGKMSRYNRYLMKLLEEATQSVIRERSLGRNVTQFKVLVNMDGFNMITHGCALCMPTYSKFVSNFDNHYPGHADEIILINTPTTFKVVMDLIRPIMREKTRKTMKVFGTDKQQWNDYLDKEISREERRLEFGGTKTD